MWEAVVFTVVASAGNNIGKVLQKQGTKGLPQLSLKLKVIQSYLLSGTWLTGVAVDILGGLLMLKAVSQAPVSVVQPVSGVGLAVLAVFSHYYLRESMHTLDWLAVAMAAAGTIGVGITGEEQKNVNVSLSRLLLFVVSLMAFFFFLNWWTHSGKQHRKAHEVPGSPLSSLSGNTMEVMDEMSAGLQAGTFFGLSAVMCKLGFIMAQRDISPLCIPAGIMASIGCSTGGFFCQTKGLKEGRAVVVSTCAAVASIVTGVLVGLLALGESLPVSTAARIFLFLGWYVLHHKMPFNFTQLGSSTMHLFAMSKTVNYLVSKSIWTPLHARQIRSNMNESLLNSLQNPSKSAFYLFAMSFLQLLLASRYVAETNLFSLTFVCVDESRTSIVAGIVLLLTSEKVGRNLPRSLRRLVRSKTTAPSRTRSSPATIPIVTPQLMSPPKYRP